MSAEVTLRVEDAVQPPLPVEEPPGRDITMLDRILRDGPGLSQQLLTTPDVQRRITSLVLVTAAGAAVFGVAIGLPGGALQALSSAVKLPLVVLGAAGISLPVLHVAQALAGEPVPPERLSALVLQAMATTTLVMAGLVPLVAILWLSYTAGIDPEHDVDALWRAYRRMVLAIVAVCEISGLIGVARLRGVISDWALIPWAFVLGLGGLQLTWLLRPLIGSPGDPVLFRPLESNGLAEVLSALLAVLGLS